MGEAIGEVLVFGVGGAYTQPRNGKGDAYVYWKRWHPGASERRWTGERVIARL